MTVTIPFRLRNIPIIKFHSIFTKAIVQVPCDFLGTSNFYPVDLALKHLRDLMTVLLDVLLQITSVSIILSDVHIKESYILHQN